MKIGIDARIWRSQTGGLGRYTRNLVRELAYLDTESDYTVIITPDDEPEYDLKAKNFTPLVVDIPHYSYAEQLELPKILARNKFDLVHFTHFNHPVRYRRPFVITVHDLIMHLYPSGAQTRSLFRKYAYRWVISDARRANKILVPSQATKRDLVSMLNFPESKLIVTPEGSEDKFRIHNNAEKAAIKQKYKLPDQYLIFVSRWEKYKGITALLNSYSDLKKDYPELGLVICGKPAKQNPEIAELIYERQKTDHRLITPGFVSDDDLAALYSAATVYVHPSWYEGFGIMILEAFSAGVPVVTSNTSSLPEVVGDAGLLADPHNEQEITDKIRSILTDKKLAASLSEKGIERAKQYSWRKMAKETLNIYQQVLDEKR